MKLESAVVAALLASLVVNVVNAAHTPKHHRALPVAAHVAHRTASAPATSTTWVTYTNAYRSVGGQVGR